MEEFNNWLCSMKTIKSEKPIVKIEVCKKENIRNYKGKKGLASFLKIYVS